MLAMPKRTPSPRHHQPRIGALLRAPAQSIRARLHAALLDAGFDDFHPAHLDVFQFPGPAGAQPSVLADRALMSRQAMNHLLGQLEERGYLRRAPSPVDARARLVELTARGRAAQTTIRSTLDAIEHELRRGLGAATYDSLHHGLIALNAHLGPYPPSGE